ncbi:type I secretion system permease/ATPase, partial [Salmonella enterica]|nr:type I secretion system permease/ATPase [Salmonella enterica]
ALDQAITSLRRRNKTVILITHRTSLLSMTSKLLLLVNGNVNAFGPTQQVLQRLKDAQKMSKFQQPVTPIVARDRKTD